MAAGSLGAVARAQGGFRPADPFDPDATPTPPGEVVIVATPVPVDARVPVPGPRLTAEEMSALLRIGFDATDLAQMSRLRQLWFLRQHMLQQNSDVEAVRSIEQRMLQARRDEGLANASSVAAALMLQANALEGERALEVAGLAVELAPDSAAIQMDAWRLQRRAGAAGGPELASLGDVARAATTNVRSRMKLLGTLAFGLLAALGTAALLFAVMVAIRHAPQFVHDLGHALSDRPNGILLITVALALVIMPLLLRMGPPAFLMWLLVLAWLYMRRTERVVAGITVLFLGALPWIVPQATGFVAFSSGEAAVLAQARDDELTLESRRTLVAMATRKPPDLEAARLLGIHYKRQGDYGRALKILQPLTQRSPADWVNVGIVQFGLGQTDDALESFAKAQGAADAAFAAYFDTAQIQFTQPLMIPAANQSMAAARAIDEERANRLKEEVDALPEKAKVVPGTAMLSATYLNRVLVEHTVDDATLMRRAFAPSGPAIPLAADLWQQYVGGIPLTRLPFVAAIALVLCTALTLVTRRATPSIRCARCADPVCVVCHGPPRQDSLCPRCAAAFVDYQDVDPAQRREQETRVNRRNRLARGLRSLSGALLPGSGHVLAGRALRGYLLAVMGCFFAAMLLGGVRLLPTELRVHGLGTASFVFAASGLVITVLISALGARRT